MGLVRRASGGGFSAQGRRGEAANRVHRPEKKRGPLEKGDPSLTLQFSMGARPPPLFRGGWGRERRHQL